MLSDLEIAQQAKILKIKEIAAKVVKEAMESAATLDIPLLAEVSFGKNWAETK